VGEGATAGLMVSPRDRAFACDALTLPHSSRALPPPQDESTSLIGAHSYTTQEMVNLALTGRARSNVFDGTKDLDGMVFRGIDKRSAERT
jgi:hypothetical protein